MEGPEMARPQRPEAPRPSRGAPRYPLAGHFSVDAAARTIRHYRYAEERLMRIMGGWIALTPELPAKLVLGRHVWDCAQHADLWGKRLPELRAPGQRSEPPSDRFVEFMDALESPDGYAQTPERLAGVYLVLKPHLVAAYERHRSLVNPVYEPPTQRILERCLAEERRHVTTGVSVLARLGSTAATAARISAWQGRLAEALERAGGVTGDGQVAVVPALDPGDPEADSDIAVSDSGFSPSRVEADLRAKVDAHARAVHAGDTASVTADLTPESRDRVLGEYAKLGAISGDPRVVACAAIGDYRIVKVRFPSAERAIVMQLRWCRAPDGWRLVDATVARTEPAG
jgi:hypothetical protein